ncbi:MAG: CobD/CbiB family protein [Burkholderiaceae bacterium]
MSFFAILFALMIEQVRPLAVTNPVYEAARSWARTARKTLDAGQRPHGWLTWSALVLLPALVALLLHWVLVWSLGWYGTVLVFALHVAVLYVTLGFRQFSHHFTVMRDALEAGDEALARATLAAWKRVDARDLPKTEVVRHVIEHSILDAHRHVFGVLGWYALLAAFGFGPVGAIVYRMSEFALRYYKRGSANAGSLLVSPSLLAAAQQAWLVVDYLPARVTALGFAIVGNFEEAIDSWRSFSQRLGRSGGSDGLNDNDGIILAATSGALNVRLGGEALKEVFAPMAAQAMQVDGILPPDVRPGTPETSAETSAGREPTVAHLRSVVGLVWRSVVLWMLLLALLTLARLLG